MNLHVSTHRTGPTSPQSAAPVTPVRQDWRSSQLQSTRPLLMATWCIALVGSLQPIDPVLHSVAFPEATIALGLDPGTASFLKSLGTIVLSASMLGVGILGDRHGRRRTMVTGVVLMAVAATLCALAPGAVVFGAGRVLMGVGTAMSFSMCLAMLPTLYSRGDLPKAFSVFFALGAAIIVLLTVVSGTILDTFGWRFMYGAVAALSVVSAALAARLLPENRAATTRRFDMVGVLLAAGGLIALIYSIGQAAVRGWGSATVVGGISTALVVLAAFAVWELRQSDPGFPIRLFRSPTFTAACLAGVLFNWADASLLGQYPALALPAGVSPSLVTSIVALMYVGMVVGSVAAGLAQRRVAQRGVAISHRAMFTSGLAFCALALGSQLAVDSAKDVAIPAFGLFLAGFAVMWMQNPQAAVIMGSAPADKLGATGAVKPAVGQLGYGLGFAIAGPIAAVYEDGAVLTPHGYGYGLATQGLIFVVAAVLVTILLRRANDAEGAPR